MPLCSSPDLQRLLNKIYDEKGLDFRGYRETSLKRRVDRRLQFSGAKDYADYINLIDQDPEEYTRLLDNLTVNLTEFFRDYESFRVIEEKVLPQIIEKKLQEKTWGLEDKKHNRPSLRIWSAGCATGEEIYSIAIVVHEILGKRIKDIDLTIYGTDIDEGCLIKAKKGEYPREGVQNMDEPRLSKWFFYNGNYKIKDEIKQLIKFLRYDLIKESYFTNIDLIMCRNVIIYFQKHLQEKILLKFHKSLNCNGILWLGTSETLTGRSKEYFAPLYIKDNIFQKMY